MAVYATIRLAIAIPWETMGFVSNAILNMNY
jgi:hypothetical protein